jgi:glycosyltransferase involved in cell wall biosynthesis
MRVAFPLIRAGSWTGGYNYLFNLVRALSIHCTDTVTPLLVCGDDVGDEETEPFAELRGVELVRAPELNQARRARSLARALLLGVDEPLRRLLVQHRVDVVFENAQFFGKRMGIPAIAWLPDFQHRQVPQLFSRLARMKRDVGFRAQIAAGRTVMLSSHDACGDCERFYPATRGRTNAVHFAVPPPPPISAGMARGVADSYGLPQEFCYLPNQFWVHKNHLLVVEALALLREQGRSVVVAASGNPRDPRDPQHFPRLCERIQTLGLQEDFRLLGLIPYPHLGALMQASSALLNPSLFEGWSTTVEEARALGVPLILSDLPVHREQAGAGAIYFDRSSAAALADALGGFRPLSTEERERRRLQAGEDAQIRVKAFAEEFAAVAKRCCGAGVA